MKQNIQFPDGKTVSNLGQGTWKLGDKPEKRESEIQAIQRGIRGGVTTIDTAEMYGDGLSEKLVGEAILPFDPDTLFLISKVYPHHADEKNMFQSCEKTLERLGVDSLDLYLLHWRGHVPLQETIDSFEKLKAQGKIKAWGVSNFDLSDMQELLSLRNGTNCQTNQVLYHLASRGVDVELRDYLSRYHIPIMAYCPIIGQQPALMKRVSKSKVVQSIAEQNGLSIIQLLLCFVLQQKNVLAIPKAGTSEHVESNIACLDIVLADDEMNQLNLEFPIPSKPVPLDIV